MKAWPKVNLCVVFLAAAYLLFNAAAYAVDSDADGASNSAAELAFAIADAGHSYIENRQLPESNEQTKSIFINAPGNDASVFVPGSTVAPFTEPGSFQIGRIVFRPSGVISYLYESNLLNASNVKSSDHLVFIQPSIEAFIPFTSNGIRLDYSWGYRNFKNFDLAHKSSHTLNADSYFVISPILSFSLRDHFVRSAIDSREYVPGRELFFSNAPFIRNDVEGQLDWTLSSSNTLGFTAGWNKAVFDKLTIGQQVIGNAGISQSNLPFYNYNEYRYGGFYRRDISPTSSYFINGLYLRSDTEDLRPGNPANSRGWEAVAGIESQITPLISGQLSAGFRRTTFPGALNQDNYGFVFRGYLAKEFSETSRVSLAASRSTNLSYFQNNSYFLTHGLGLTFVKEMGPRLICTLSPSYQRNSYPLDIVAGPGVPNNFPIGVERRVDQILEFGFDARYRFTDWVAIDLLFGVVHRDSVLPDYRFTDYRVGMSLVLGRKESGRGQLPY